MFSTNVSIINQRETYECELDDHSLGWKKTGKEVGCGFGELYALKYRKLRKRISKKYKIKY